MPVSDTHHVRENGAAMRFFVKSYVKVEMMVCEVQLEPNFLSSPSHAAVNFPVPNVSIIPLAFMQITTIWVKHNLGFCCLLAHLALRVIVRTDVM